LNHCAAGDDKLCNEPTFDPLMLRTSARTDRAFIGYELGRFVCARGNPLLTKRTQGHDIHKAAWP